MGCLNSVSAIDGPSGPPAYAQPYQPAYAQSPYQPGYQPGGQPGYQPGGQPGYQPGGQPGVGMGQQQQQPQHIKCGRCGNVFGVPPGHAQAQCPYCGAVQACPQQAKPSPSIPSQVYNQSLGVQPAAGVGQPGPPPTGRRKALLVGINYFNTQAELKGCINDVHRMKGLLMQMYGFMDGPDSMLVLTDDNPNQQLRPTRANMIGAFAWLVQGVQPGDVLFFHYSGHGAQQEDPNYAEEDGYDETVCPADFNSAGMIVDDEIFDRIVGTLPPGAKLTAVMDCCHSGTGLDLPFILEYGAWTEEDNPCHSAGDVVLISGAQDEQTAADGGGSATRPMGAMTTALCNALERNKVLSYSQLLDQLQSELSSGGFDQVPNITSSQRFDPNSKPFHPCENIEGNSNPQLGRQFRKKKHPKNEGLLNSGLGSMLLAGAAGFMVADVLGGGEIASGLLIAGGDALAGGVGGATELFTQEEPIEADGGGGDYESDDDGGGGGGGFFGFGDDGGDDGDY